MQNTVITHPEQVTRTWLQTTLGRSGVIQSGEIQSFQIEHASNDNSQGARIRVTYTAEATGSLPGSLYLKICPAQESSFGPSEVNYYLRDYIATPDAPIPTCYDAQYADLPGRYHILMEDLSASHQPNWDVPPNLDFGLGVAESLAVLHAPYWEANQRTQIQAAVPGPEILSRYLEHLSPGIAPLLDWARAGLNPRQADALAAILEHLPEDLLARTRDPLGFSLVHGDPNPGNILSPREEDGKIYLVDRQPFDWSLTTWLGVYDLAYLMGLWWEPEQRRQLEFSMLRRYRSALKRRDILYPLDRLLEDYRLCLAQCVYIPVDWCIQDSDRERMGWLWQVQLRRVLEACRDFSYP